MIRLDAATVLLQWAAGTMLFLWFTTRRHTIGAGYGWLLRGTAAVLAAGGTAAGLATETVPVREAAGILFVVATLATLGRRRPVWDLVPAVVALAGLVAGGVAAADGAGDTTLGLVRILVGMVFLGAVSDAMLLGHWYLVQPGLPRSILVELVRTLRLVTPLEIAVLLVPTGMVSVFTGAVDDGWNGTLGWFWVACAVTTVALTEVTLLALRERSYSAVMAATGLMYLAILTAFGTDLVARAVLA